MYHFFLYKVVILLPSLLVWRVSHPSSCKSFVTDNGYLEKFVLQNRASCCHIGLPAFLTDKATKITMTMTMTHLSLITSSICSS